MSKCFRIGDFARVCGVSPRTVDYYTRLGLLTPSHRSSGQHRLYDDDSVQQMRRIRELQSRRLTLEEIAGELEHVGEDVQDALPRLQHIEEVLARLDREVASLRPDLAGLSQAGRMPPAVVRTLSTAIAYALTLANQLSHTLAEGGIHTP